MSNPTGNPADNENISVDTLAETESYVAWKSLEPDGETTWHIDVGNVTLHFFEEEWAEFQELTRQIAARSLPPSRVKPSKRPNAPEREED